MPRQAAGIVSAPEATQTPPKFRCHFADVWQAANPADDHDTAALFTTSGCNDLPLFFWRADTVASGSNSTLHCINPDFMPNIYKSIKFRVLMLVFLTLVCVCAPARADSAWFGIHVVDAQDGRGVPLVELKTTAAVRYYTDSAGFAVIDDPVLLGRKAFFFVASDGYVFPADGFGMHGKALDVRAGAIETLKVERKNIAQRLYRMTGEGIYRDSVMLGKPYPIRDPLLNAQVTGQDSTMAAVCDGMIHWFWGDTMKPGYPLGHFGTSGAVSDLAGHGGLDPSVGVNFTYYTDADGFARPTLAGSNGTLRWLDGLAVVNDQGTEKMVGLESDHKGGFNAIARKLVVWNGEKNAFDVLAIIPPDVKNGPDGHMVHATMDGTDYLMCGVIFPNVRVKADLKSLADFKSYEAFTCLAPGTTYKNTQSPIERNGDGTPLWAWKKDTSALTPDQLLDFHKAGKLKESDMRFVPMDVDSGKPIRMQGGSASFNAYRHKWVEIAGQKDGSSSFLGEIWVTEADRPEGPWLRTKKIVTHNRYSLYNPVQYPFFEQEDGRLIYFSGTYATTFSRYGDPVPRYDYNNIMYRLDLADPRLAVVEGSKAQSPPDR